MKKTIPKKIHIIGSVGSGKTTLAKELSSKYNVPFYELDNIVWERHKSGDIRRSEEERRGYLNTILNSEAWIIEGIHNEEWVTNSFHNAELILFLDTNYSIRILRIIKRFAFQKIGLEKSNYKPTFKVFLKMFKWNKYFENVGKPGFFEKIEVYSNKLLVVKNRREIKNYFHF
ncbi:AAA family ATPase [Neobacillus sp. PS3-40]|uniref:AAA family ATPase n=1 Tax=Neobacillus sp. PS3-40 TaxID=3070679 RepID=UPI0027E0A01A|nr:AAA family ATPase [Neobacillus sp. PS3-40]WML43989.1 AAA family ATPase [Neobacillus sp. PS3-40]